MIRILTYYQGQSRLFEQKAKRERMTQRNQEAIGVYTVVSFQGREAQVVVVDTVAAKGKHLSSPTQEEDTTEDTEASEVKTTSKWVRLPGT